MTKLFKKRNVIVYSELDDAGVNIAENLLKISSWEKEEVNGLEVWLQNTLKAVLLPVETDIVFTDYLENLNPQIFIFISRHSSESGKPSFTVHTPGNWLTNVSHGGKPKSLGVSNPLLQRFFLLKLSETIHPVNVSLEVTHHGPTELKKPVTFIEIGSSPREWRNKSFGEFIAETILEALKKFNYETRGVEKAVGVGGPHYAPKFTDLTLKGEVAIGHIVPRYVLQNLDLKMLEQAIERTHGKTNLFLIDKKGTKRKKEITNKIEELGFDYKFI